MRVLIVEDDREPAEYVRKGLAEEGYLVQVCFDGSAPPSFSTGTRAGLGRKFRMD
jgi:DNA-binding response OmpR family regulator